MFPVCLCKWKPNTNIKNVLKTFEAEILKIFGNIQPQSKIRCSYKKGMCTDTDTDTDTDIDLFYSPAKTVSLTHTRVAPLVDVCFGTCSYCWILINPIRPVGMGGGQKVLAPISTFENFLDI